MLEKLTEAKLIEWTPRSGIRLVEKGREMAKSLIANHITTELFLMRALKINDTSMIEQMACDFEHHMTPEMTAKLQELLGIEDITKNVDNFILDDKLPEHLGTHRIFSEAEVIQNIRIMEEKVLLKVSDANDQSEIKAIFENRIEQIQKEK